MSVLLLLLLRWPLLLPRGVREDDLRARGLLLLLLMLLLLASRRRCMLVR